MQISEKLKLIRHSKKLSQEDVAYQLGISPSAYGSIERGETKLSLERLEELAKVFEIDLNQLLDSSEQNIFNFGGTHSNHCQNWHTYSQTEQSIALQHELEKMHLLLQEREKEVGYLKQ
jgi:transcriptional regulator with XRE-family HTH domain